MKKGIGVSTHTKTIRQNGVTYRYVYVLKNVVLRDEISEDELKSYDFIKGGANGLLYCFNLEHRTKQIDAKIYGALNHKSGRPVGSKDSYKRTRTLYSKKKGY